MNAADSARHLDRWAGLRRLLAERDRLAELCGTTDATAHDHEAREQVDRDLAGFVDELLPMADAVTGLWVTMKDDVEVADGFRTWPAGATVDALTGWFERLGYAPSGLPDQVPHGPGQCLTPVWTEDGNRRYLCSLRAYHYGDCA